ncbi:MAG TPA: TonB-dependent receptor [Hyphomonadaceae bacterium]|nr:TonB-dependent receptor [Hyphomonadaceae bacterium]
MKNWVSKAVLVAAIAAPGGEAVAQQPAPPQPQQGATTTFVPDGVKTYDPAFFSRYNPVTAFDMVRQVPGFIINNGESLRGFGATAGNVLIDGQRPSSKNSISDELLRIAARDVLRIEIIGAAAAGDIDVRGYTELANVVLKPATETQVSTTWNTDLAWQGQRVSARAGATRSWKTDDVTTPLNVQAYNRGQRSETDITVHNASDVLLSTREEFNQQVLSELLINGSVNWAASARDSVNITGRLTPRLFTSNTGSISYSPAGIPTQYVADDYTEKDILYADLGGDWEHKFSPQNSVKLILVNRLVNWRPQELFEQFTPSGVRTFAQEINTEVRTGEHVVRGVWTLKPGDAHTIDAGLEGAFNYRDQHRAVANDTGAGFVPVFLPVATTRVEEVRGEAFITDTWRIDPKLTLELGFTYEASKITQTGDAEQEREFSYPKPRAIATWRPNGTDQFRLAFERVVAQLDFSEFASTLVPVQGTVTVGNPDLEPAQTWESSLQWKRPIGQRGSLSVTGYYHQIEDVQDFIPIWPIPTCPPPSTDPACVLTAAGNIGDGERWGVNVEATFPLDALIKGGILKITGGARDSRVTDPITGQERRITNDLDYNWNIDFRQDLPELKLAWGGDYTGSGESDVFRLNEHQIRSAGEGDLDLFIETTRFKGMTLRLAADNIGNMPSQTERRFFSPNRVPGGVFAGSEYREQTQGPIFTFTVTGSL